MKWINFGVQLEMRWEDGELRRRKGNERMGWMETESEEKENEGGRE